MCAKRSYGNKLIFPNAIVNFKNYDGKAVSVISSAEQVVFTLGLVKMGAKSEAGLVKTALIGLKPGEEDQWGTAVEWPAWPTD